MQLGLPLAMSLSEWWSRHCYGQSIPNNASRWPVAEDMSWTGPLLQVTGDNTLILAWKMSQALLTDPGLLVPLKSNILYTLVY